MFQKAHSPYVQAFFNYLSIVEICIDKGLSGGDLCSRQLSQRKDPPQTPTGSIGMRNTIERPLGAEMIVREHVGRRGESRRSS